MTHTLMHKDLPVADLDFDQVTGSIGKIGTIHYGSHLPIGVPLRKGVADRAALNKWWDDRSVPSNRSEVREALENLGVASPKLLLSRCCGLSHSNHSWDQTSGQRSHLAPCQLF